MQRMHSLVESSGLELHGLRAVHVAGTNGKGSVCAMVERVARNKKKTGLYVSPHLVELNERIQVGGQQIGDARLAELAEWARPFQKKTGASFFETITLIAFKHFSDRGVEVAVVETGLGGRLDATNVLPQSLPVITDVSMDHSEKLGNSLRGIARDRKSVV